MTAKNQPDETLFEEARQWLLDLEQAIIRYDEDPPVIGFDAEERLQAFCDKIRPADRPRPKRRW